MQTFLPFADFDQTAQILDKRRLNKQLLEGRQIYNIISSNKMNGPWTNHPAVKMWRNYDNALFDYLLAIKIECNTRGIETTKNWEAITTMHKNNWHRGSKAVLPPWWNDDRVHLSHRQNLYKKDPEYYAYFVDDNRLSAVSCCDTCRYFWPVAGHAKQYTPDPNWQVDKSLLINLDW